MRFRFVVTSAVLRGLQAELDADQPITVGRVGGNSLVLDHKSVSRHHARLEANGSALRLVDLKSHNGTRVGEELISERLVQPGDVLGFGEVRVQFIAVDPAAAGASAYAPATETAGLPVLASAAGPGMALAKPLSVEEIFGGPAGAQAQTASPPTAASRVSGTLLYVLALVAVLVSGALAYWKVGQRPPKPPLLDVPLRAGDTLPVNVGPRWDAANERALGISSVERIGEPGDQGIAYVTKTMYSGFVVVHGRAVGTTDVPIEGPGTERVILRVLVRGVRPEPEHVQWLQALPHVRRQRAEKLIHNARLVTPKGDLVDEHTSDAIRDYELAAKLLDGIPGETRRADDAAKEAARLRGLRDRKFDELNRRIADLFREGRYREADEAAQDLLRIYRDPGSEEYAVVRLAYELLLNDIAEVRRKQEQEEKERR